jgi:hypothetical protein
VGPRAILNTVVKRKILSPLRESNPRTLDSSAHSLVAIPNEISQKHITVGSQKKKGKILVVDSSKSQKNCSGL